MLYMFYFLNTFQVCLAWVLAFSIGGNLALSPHSLKP